MNRAIAIVIACCVLTISTEAQSRDTLTAVPGVKAPATLVLDTVLFRLPRANLAPGELVSLGDRRSGPRLYGADPVTVEDRRVVRRCFHTKDGLVWVTDGFKMRSDGVRVGETRLALGACGGDRGSSRGMPSVR